ncbi:MAG: leucine-rich repeat protein [Lachnospiraceae bacterium]|nr:leucine-rich repeat protein [Lachnospiraceae bacterium]
MNNYIKSIIKKKKQIALTVISAMIVIVLIMGQDRFREHVRADDRVQVEDTGIVLSNILYTLYPDGTAEVTQVGADKSDPDGYIPDEIYDYDSLHEQFDYDLGDVRIPETIQANGKTYTVTSVGAKAFVGSFCYGKITLPDTIVYLGDYAFYQRRIEEITLPDSITEMGIGVFEQTEIEGELVFSASMDTIPYRTFYRTIVWQRLVIPDTVTKLERYAVILDRYPIEAGALLPGKTEVVLSKNLKEAGECAFYASPKYCVVKLSGKGENVIQDGMLFNKKKTELIMALEPVVGDYHIPKTVRRIHAYAFSAVSQGADPANGATGRIWVPEGVSVLEQGTFRNCFWLKSLSLPSTIERIEAGAWSCISLDQPNTGNGLRNLVIKAKNPPEIIGKQKTLRYINVPNSSIADYEEALSGKVGYKKLY